VATLDVSVEQGTISFQNSAIYQGSPARRTLRLGYGTRIDIDVTNNDVVDISITASIWRGATGTPVLQSSINGGPWTDFTMPSASTFGDQAVPNASALGPGTHRVSLRHKPASTVNEQALEYDRFITITYTTNAPTIAQPSDFGTIYSIGQAPLAACSVLEGAWTRNTSLSAGPGGGIWAVPDADSEIRIRADVTEIWAGIYTNSASSWRVVVDDDVTSSPVKVTPTNNSAMDWIQLASSLSGMHRYDIVPVVPGNGVFISQLRLVGGTGLDLTYRPTLGRGALLGLGNSICLGVTGVADSSRSWLSRLGHATNRRIVNRGQSSNPLVSTWATPGIQDRWHQVMMYGSTADDVLIIEAGTNDANVASPDQTAIQKAMEALLERVTGGQPGFAGPPSKVIVVGLLPYTSGNLGTHYAATNASIAAAVAAVNHASVVDTYPPDWTDPVYDMGTMMQDLVHPNAIGSDAYYTNILPLVTTWSAPSSGVVGVIGE
jgi:lysophospholipase L1-like esterase